MRIIVTHCLSSGSFNAALVQFHCPQVMACGGARHFRMEMMAQPNPDQYQLFTGKAARAPLPECADTQPAAAPASQEAASVAIPDNEPRLALCVLGSGSGGNCTAVSYGGRLLLIDAGFGPRVVAKRLEMCGAVFSQISGICLTHLDSDHFRPHLINTLLRWQIPVYVYQNHLERYWRLPDARALYEAGLVKVFTSRPFCPIEGMTVSMVRLAHDKAGTCAFRMHTSQGSIGYATDLGQVPDDLLTHLADVDLLAIESNYDRAMQLASARPRFLKDRIMGGSGHLSNEECLGAIDQVIAQSQGSGPEAIVLLHRSRQCNCPTLLKQIYEQREDLVGRVILSEQDTPSPWLRVKRSR